MVTVALAGPSAMSGSDTGFCDIGRTLRHRFREHGVSDQPQRRESCERGKAGQGQGGGEGASRDDQGLLPKMARLERGLFASLKRLRWQWPVRTASLPRRQFRFIAAPNRASAARDSSSSTEDRDTGDFGHLLRVRGAARRGPLAPRQRRLAQRQFAHRTPAEEAVDPLQDHVRGMLDLQRHRALDPQHQGGRLLRLAFDRPRPLHLQGLRMGGDFRAGNLGPAGHQLARGKALLGIGVGEDVAEQEERGFALTRPGLDIGNYITAG